MSPYDCSKCVGKDSGCDKNVCQIDHIEACVVHLMCPYNQTLCDKGNQWKQAKFAYCMEFTHKGTSAKFAKKCADYAGIDFSDITDCLQGDTSVKVMDYINHMSEQSKVAYYPDIRVNGEETQGDYTTVKGMLKILCDGYNGPNPPAACNNQSSTA